LTLALAATAIASEAVIIIDDDTIAIGHERIRLLDIDAAESFRSRCTTGIVLGLKEKEQLNQLALTPSRSGSNC
jgi:hypothetical protein